MKKGWAAGLVSLALLPGVASAGPYGDDLSKCLVAATTPEDKALLVKWIFSAISLNEDIAPFVSMPASKREALSKETAGLYMRLMTESCRSQLRDAYRYEGSGAIGNAFNLLGQVASQEMFAAPSVAAGLEGLTRHFDQTTLNAALEGK
ncbi:hypothetical protein [Lysobacter niastensis]|uniref:Uncharacterized protein n=1 Tax=Lysobacter niastensis TaxID=380629 RepID=A0ABS0B442_9GAMM|nr:hypothetical protein [Lysobacter niastensis]MBF6023305.1 hypothetical protein [Lysobacter niastensis]